MIPLKMIPEIKYPVWGGTKLRDYYHKNCTQDNAGESWEVSTHPSGLSIIANGEWEGMSLADAIKKNPGQIAPDDFPFLFKIIDAEGDLSIQVHPDDTFAQQYENSPRGKTEMWYVIDAKPGAKIGYGWNREMTKELIRTSAENGTMEQYINYIPVKPGEAYFIPAGTVHCIGSGLLIAEIQQNSDVTYRLYDYNRKDKNGKGRELHIDKSLAVSGLSPMKDANPVSGENVTLASCPYFTAETITGENYQGDTKGAFEILFFIDGEGEIISSEGSVRFRSGDTFLMPSSLGAYQVSGRHTIMRCTE